MQFDERLTLDAPKRTKDGYLAVRARAARSGIYDYLGSEVDPEGKHFKATDIVKVYRPEEEVFAKDSIASFIGKPVTNDHPTVPVNADNWATYSRGAIMGAIRDKEYVAYDMLIMDGSTIQDIEAGKRELSNGYSSELVFGDGTTPQGEKYNAIQKNIRGNHCAVVRAGRAGPLCRISDSQFAVCDANPGVFAGRDEKDDKVTKITLDGYVVDLSDADAVQAAFAKKNEAFAEKEKELADAKASVATLTAEKAAMQKQLDDAKASIDPEKLDKMVADRAALVDSAKALKADLVVDGKTNDQIRREVVDAKLGADAKEFSDEQIAAAFAVIARDVKDASATVVSIETPKAFTDTSEIRDRARARRYAN